MDIFWDESIMIVMQNCLQLRRFGNFHPDSWSDYRYVQYLPPMYWLSAYICRYVRRPRSFTNPLCQRQPSCNYNGYMIDICRTYLIAEFKSWGSGDLICDKEKSSAQGIPRRPGAGRKASPQHFSNTVDVWSCPEPTNESWIHQVRDCVQGEKGYLKMPSSTGHHAVF